MNTLNTQVNELPKALRSFIQVGAFFKEVLDKADANAQVRAEAGQQPNLLDDVMKDGQVHVARLEEVLTEIAGRTKAKTVVELMTHAHGLMGMYNVVSDMFAGEDGDGEDAARDGRRASSQAARPANDASPPHTGRFRPEFTSAARQAQQAAPSAAPQPAARQAQQATPSAAPTPAAHEATAPATATRPPTTGPGTSRAEALTAVLDAFKMDVARHLLAFEQAVAEEQADLRGRMIQQSLEAAGIRADLRLIDPEHVPAARAPASTVEEHAAAQPAVKPVAQPAAEPVAQPAASCAPVETPHEAEDVDPATPDTQGDVANDDDDKTLAKYAAEISNMMNESHARVHASLMSDRAQADGVDEQLRELRKHVTRLKGSS